MGGRRGGGERESSRKKSIPVDILRVPPVGWPLNC